MSPHPWKKQDIHSEIRKSLYEVRTTARLAAAYCGSRALKSFCFTKTRTKAEAVKMAEDWLTDYKQQRGTR